LSSLICLQFIYQAWERCTTKEWNFSGKCLTSKRAQTALNNYLRSHPQLRKEIEDRTGVVHGLEEPDAHNVAMEDDCPNDSDVPSSLVIQDVLRINISATEGGVNMSEIHISAARLDESGGLVAVQRRRIYGHGTMAKNGAMCYLLFQTMSR
jgi:hypothetical protein